MLTKPFQITTADDARDNVRYYNYHNYYKYSDIFEKISDASKKGYQNITIDVPDDERDLVLENTLTKLGFHVDYYPVSITYKIGWYEYESRKSN